MIPPLRVQVGSLFVVGLEGPALSKSESAWLRLLQPAGIILFRRNIPDAAQGHALLSSCAEHLSEPAFRCVDLEGGTVDRLRDAIAPLPAAETVARTQRKRDARMHGELVGAEAHAVGFNVVLAPVLDLALPISRAVMTTRVAGADADAVIRYAEPFLKGLSSHNILGCGKHFPGLGGGNLDSHNATPHIERDWRTLWQEDLAPYRALRRQLPIVMVSHAAYALIAEDGQQPASLSAFWINSVLRKKIGYRGLVISDDMEMGGVMSQTSIESACIFAIAAGTDLLEICHQPDLILRGYEAVLREAERSAAFAKQVALAAERVAAAKRKHLCAQNFPSAPTSATISKLKRSVEKFTAEIAKGQPR